MRGWMRCLLGLGCLWWGWACGTSGIAEAAVRWGDWQEVDKGFYRLVFPDDRVGVDHLVNEEGRWFRRVVVPGAPLESIPTPEGFRGKYPGLPFLWRDWVLLGGKPVRRVFLPRTRQTLGVNERGGWVRLSDGLPIPRPKGIVSVPDPGKAPGNLPEVSVAAPGEGAYRWEAWTRTEDRVLRRIVLLPEKQGRTLFVDPQGRWFGRTAAPGAKLTPRTPPESLGDLRPGRPFFLEDVQMIEGLRVRRVVFDPNPLGVSTYRDDQGRWYRRVVVPNARLEPIPVPEGVVP